MRQEKISFFDRTDWLAFWASTIVALLVYLFSLGPSVGLEDAGELAVAADVLGVPHPPGYPLWTMLSWGFCRLFSWVTWQGYPNPAWAVAFASAVMGAVATGITAMLITRSGRDLLSPTCDTHKNVFLLSGVAGSLAFAFSPVMWSQSVIVEVYALGALFLALTLLLTYRWMMKPCRATLVWLGLVFGLGLTNYQVLLLAALPIAWVIIMRRWRLAISFVAVFIPFILTAYLLSLGALPSANVYSTKGAPVILRPETMAPLWVYGLFALSGLATVVMACMRKLKGLLIPVSLLVALSVITAINFAPSTLPLNFNGTLYNFVRAWGVHFLGLAILWGLCFRYHRMRCFATAVTIIQCIALALMQQGLLLGLTHPTTGWFWWGIVWGGLVLLMAHRLILQGRTVAWTLFAAVIGVSVYVYMPLVSDLLNPAMNWGYARTWEGFTRAISRGQYEALELSSFFSVTYWQQLCTYGIDLFVQFSLPVVLIAIVGTCVLVRHVIQTKHRIGILWLTGTLGFFLVMSAVLIALANPVGDVQDSFIQKVKFISSHGIFAVWIGYGLCILLNRFRRAWIVAVIVPLIPINGNFTDDHLVATMGAAEQTGHDYGWQFGAYMLNGAPTICAELNVNEEPLPDPFYPPPMETNAVFFGGTDPGRFVPTYMVYSADFRPDISVFTQNALADPTYMNVQRDLYGDTLWVPTADEVVNAFSDYVDAVQRGERTTRGTILETNGRVQITGPAAIMDINAELAQRFYAMNADRAFYIEESFPMPWMTRFLAPAGLAMKLQREESNLEAGIAQDADFWDWMARRLISDAGYRRDVAAQKSFSKLRCAIGRLYSKRQLEESKGNALREAFMLYPLSPEAMLQYVQEVLLMPSIHAECRKIGSRFRVYDAYRMVRRYIRLDPKNEMAQRLFVRTKRLAEAQGVVDRVYSELESTTTAEMCEMALACEILKEYEYAEGLWKLIEQNAHDLTSDEAWTGCVALLRMGKDATLAKKFLQRVTEATLQKATEAELLTVSNLCQEQADPTRAFQLLKIALTKVPESAEVWVAIALLYSNNGEGARAYEAFKTALRVGAASILQSDRAVAEVYLQLDKRYGPKKGAR